MTGKTEKEAKVEGEEPEGEGEGEGAVEGAGEGEGEGEGEKTVQAEVEVEDSLKVITQLTKFIYNCPSGELGRIRTRAMLCQIYHHALHDRCVLRRCSICFTLQ